MAKKKKKRFSVSDRLRFLCYRFIPSIVKIETVDTNNDTGIGTGFHVGGGYIATARHVADELKSVIPHHFIGSASYDAANHEGELALDVLDVYRPADSMIDLAVIKTDWNSDHYMKKMNGFYEGKTVKNYEHLTLANMYDEDFPETAILLSQVLILGFPPIPQSSDSYVVAVRADISAVTNVVVAVKAEVNAVVAKYNKPHSHLVLSSTARGGLSGAPVIDLKGEVIGICTESLNRNNQIVETGFQAAISVDPLNRLLADNAIFPGSN